MEGDGTSVITAEIGFRDSGLDIQTLWVRMPDGRSMQICKSFATETGTFIETLAMPTDQIGVFSIEIQLVDQAGDSSVGHTACYSVSNWTSRVSGLPFILNDVIWDGTVFIAVGDEGGIFTSADGLDWIARESGAEANLHAVAAYGSDILAVGENILLQSTDHGETWTLKNDPNKAWRINDQFFSVSLSAVAINSSRVVVSGTGICCEPIILIFEDRGDTWQVINVSPGDGTVSLRDRIDREGLFVAVADILHITDDAGWVFVSSDGTQWSDIFLDPESGFRTIVDDGSRFTVAGSNGIVITSIDGINWTEMQTPFEGVDYLSGAWNGTKLMLAGSYTCTPTEQAAEGFNFDCSAPQPGLPLGISSADGGSTWDIFNIDGEFRSLGMVYGNGRFVSVGVSETGVGEGAIYSAD
jgi:photosystem II stability/assembly factor-like uncharacterized protein